MIVRELVTVLGFRTDMSSLRAAERKIQTASRNMARFGRAMTMRVTLPIVLLGVGILKAAGDFEFAMNRVMVLTSATGDEFEKLKQQAKDLGRTTVFSASDAAGGMGFLAQAGFDANEIYAAMPATLNLAAAAQQDLAVTADQISNIMQGFGIDAREAGRASDVIAYTAASANTNVSQFAEAMKYAAPLARLVGISLEEAAAMVAFMGNAGIQASMAGTTMRGALARLLEITPKVGKEFKRLGISLYHIDKTGRRARKPLIDILSEIEGLGLASDDLAASLTVIFGRRAVSGIAAILGQGIDPLREFVALIGEEGLGAALKQSEIQMKGLRGAMKRLKSTAEASAIAIAESGLMDYVEKLVRKFADFFENLAKTNPELLRMGVIAALATAAIGPLVSMVASLGLALTAISAHPIILVLAALIALYGMMKYFETETGKKKLNKIGDDLKNKVIRAEAENKMSRLGWQNIKAKRGSPEYQEIYAATAQGYYERIAAGQYAHDQKLISKGKAPLYGTGSADSYDISISQQNEIQVTVPDGASKDEITDIMTGVLDGALDKLAVDIEKNISVRE